MSAEGDPPGVTESLDERSIARRLRALQVIAAAFILAIALYGLVAHVASRVPLQQGSEPAPYFAPVLMLLAALAMGVAPIVERFVLSRASDRPLSTFFVATLIGLALREAGAVYGLIAALATREPGWFGAAASVSVAALLFAWPRRARLDAHLAASSADHGDGRAPR